MIPPSSVTVRASSTSVATSAKSARGGVEGGLGERRPPLHLVDDRCRIDHRLPTQRPVRGGELRGGEDVAVRGGHGVDDPGRRGDGVDGPGGRTDDDIDEVHDAPIGELGDDLGGDRAAHAAALDHESDLRAVIGAFSAGAGCALLEYIGHRAAGIVSRTHGSPFRKVNVRSVPYPRVTYNAPGASPADRVDDLSNSHAPRLS